jgi:hypothetical protein
MTKFSIVFLTQEEPESGNDRKVLSACPSTGSMEIFSDAKSYGELLQEIKTLFQEHADSYLLEKCQFADEQTIQKYWETDARS